MHACKYKITQVFALRLLAFYLFFFFFLVLFPYACLFIKMKHSLNIVILTSGLKYKTSNILRVYSTRNNTIKITEPTLFRISFIFI